jgi:NAD(P) transhydrogenase subunit alpha
MPGAAALWAASDIVFKVRVADAEEVGLLREGGTLIGFIWPAQNPELMQQLAAKRPPCWPSTPAAPALPRAEDGRADLQAGVSRLPRRDRGRQRLRPLLQRPDHRRRQGAAGQGLHRRRRRRRPGRDRHGAGLGAIVRANDTRAEVADQVVSLGGEFVKVDYEEEGSGGGGYAKVMSEGFQQAQREMYAKQAGSRHHHHHRADPGKPAPG